MGTLNQFEVMYSYISDSLYKKTLNEINEISNTNTDDLSFKQVNRLIYLYELNAISYRRLLQNKELNPTDQDIIYCKRNNLKEKNNTSSFDNLPVFVEKISTKFGELIYIHAPFTFKRGVKESFNLATYLNAALIKYQEETNSNYLDFNCKKMVYAIRVADKFNFKKHCDNDNLELSEMINMMFSHIGTSDNSLKMSFISEFLESSNESIQGINFIVAPYDLPLMKAQEMMDFIQEKITNSKTFIYKPSF